MGVIRERCIIGIGMTIESAWQSKRIIAHDLQV